MHPGRVIVRTHIRSDGLYTRTDIHNILTGQSADTNAAPRDPPYSPVTWNPARTRPSSAATSTTTSTTLCITAVGTITASTSPLRQEPTHCHISYLTLVFSSASAVSLVTFFNLIWLTIFCLIRLNCGFYLSRLTSFSDSIWLMCNVFVFGSRHTIWITSQSGLREYHIGQGVFKIFQHWNRGILHNSDHWIWVWR